MYAESEGERVVGLSVENPHKVYSKGNWQLVRLSIRLMRVDLEAAVRAKF